MAKILLILIIATSGCQLTPIKRAPTKTTILNQAQLILQTAKTLAGNDSAFGQRALFFYDLYLESKNNLSFALSLSHLSLSIERSLQTKDNLKTSAHYKAYESNIRYLQNKLGQLNKELFIRIYVAHQLVKNFKLYEIRDLLLNRNLYANNELRPIIKSIVPILKPLNEVQIAAQSGRLLSAYAKKLHNQTFTMWEHKDLFQPVIDVLKIKLNPDFFSYLKNIPTNPIKLSLANYIFGIKVYLSLDCFPADRPILAIKDFTDYRERILQSLKFSDYLAKLNYDPALVCFNDPSYVSHFGSDFFYNPRNYIDSQKNKLLSQEKPIHISRKPIRKVDIFDFSNPVRLFEILKEKNYCDQDIDKFWKPFAQNFIYFNDKKLLTSSIINPFSTTATLESSLLTNAKINQAYIALFTESTRRSEPQQSFYPASWLGSAALGSYSVGKQLTYLYHSKIQSQKEKFPKIYSKFEKLNSRYSEEEIQSFMNPLHDVFTHRYPYVAALAEGNRAVFDSIFWQYLTYHFCGADKLIRYLEKNLSPITKIVAWRHAQKGDFKSASLLLLRYEQETVLQPILYASLAAQFVGDMKLVNEYAQPGLDQRFALIDDFDTFSTKFQIVNNIANLESRMKWVNYIVEEHAKVFENFESQKRTKEIFSDVLNHITYTHLLIH